MKNYSRVYAKIDLDAIASNVNEMKKKMKSNTQIMAVIKADGYGHGAVPIAKMLEDKDFIWGVAVATLDEALVLRSEGIKKPILVLGCVFPDQYLEMIRNIHIRTYNYIANLKASTNPLGFTQGGFLNGHLNYNDKIGLDMLRPMTASFGFTALNELCLLHNGKTIREDNSFAVEVMQHITEKIKSV